MSQPHGRPPTEAGRSAPGVDGEHARHLLRGLRARHAADAGVRVGRAHEARVGLVGELDVVGVLAGADEEARVFLALDARADGPGGPRVAGGARFFRGLSSRCGR
jgi:hypothetical protein